MLCHIQIMFVRREYFSRGHEFAEMPQPANFARRDKLCQYEPFPLHI